MKGHRRPEDIFWPEGDYTGVMLCDSWTRHGDFVGAEERIRPSKMMMRIRFLGSLSVAAVAVLVLMTETPTE